ncbi:hypothetical protein ACOSQ2_023949 [Xanthoceras sorbifolium]
MNSRNKMSNPEVSKEKVEKGHHDGINERQSHGGERSRAEQASGYMNIDTTTVVHLNEKKEILVSLTSAEETLGSETRSVLK